MVSRWRSGAVRRWRWLAQTVPARRRYSRRFVELYTRKAAWCASKTSCLRGRPAYAIARAGVLLVPEGRQILGPLTVEENLRIGARAAGDRASRGDAEIERVFALFPILAERRRQAAGQLSGGQQQMLVIGRAMMGKPRVLLLDEPSLGLGPNVVSQVFAALAELHERGLSMLLVEQNARKALEVTTYAYVMERGRIVHQGASRDLQADSTVIDHYLGV
jgi:branched-chain amino acid transport system ATP-binding protein